MTLKAKMDGTERVVSVFEHPCIRLVEADLVTLEDADQAVEITFDLYQRNFSPQGPKGQKLIIDEIQRIHDDDSINLEVKRLCFMLHIWYLTRWIDIQDGGALAKIHDSLGLDQCRSKSREMMRIIRDWFDTDRHDATEMPVTLYQVGRQGEELNVYWYSNPDAAFSNGPGWQPGVLVYKTVADDSVIFTGFDRFNDFACLIFSDVPVMEAPLEILFTRPSTEAA